MRLLVTGVSGLLGLNLAVQAADRFDVTGVMRGGRAQPAPGAPFDTILADLTDVQVLERVVEQSAPDVIINCAALTEVDYCEAHPEEAHRINSELPGRIACLAAQSGAKLLHISTDSVFDGLRGGYCEEDEPNPVNVYARTKLEGEHAVAQADPDAIIARVNFYGWSWQGRRSLSEWFFLNLSQGKSIFGFADIVFSPLLVNDMIEILLRMIEKRLSGLYHVVSPESQSKFAFGRLLAREFGFDEKLVSPAAYREAGLKAVRSPLLNLHPDKLTRALGDEPPGQEVSMRRYGELYRHGHPQFLRSLLLEQAPPLADKPR